MYLSFCISVIYLVEEHMYYVKAGINFNVYQNPGCFLSHHTHLQWGIEGFEDLSRLFFNFLQQT